MSTASPLVSTPNAKMNPKFGALFKAVLFVTAIVGTLDIVAAHIHLWFARGSFPTTVFKGIASGAIGRERAFQGGVEIVALGAFFHYLITFSFTLLYFLLISKFVLLRNKVWISGMTYGFIVWALMNFLVLPFSALSAKTPDFANKHTYLSISILVLLFGLPIASGAARYHRPRAAKKTNIRCN